MGAGLTRGFRFLEHWRRGSFVSEVVASGASDPCCRRQGQEESGDSGPGFGAAELLAVEPRKPRGGGAAGVPLSAELGGSEGVALRLPGVPLREGAAERSSSRGLRGEGLRKGRRRPQR